MTAAARRLMTARAACVRRVTAPAPRSSAANSRNAGQPLNRLARQPVP